jgi:hypothetical protein
MDSGLFPLPFGPCWTSGLAGWFDGRGEPLLAQALLVEFHEFFVARLRHRPPFRVRLPRNLRRRVHGHLRNGLPQPPDHPVDRVPVVVQY